MSEHPPPEPGAADPAGGTSGHATTPEGPAHDVPSGAEGPLPSSGDSATGHDPTPAPTVPAIDLSEPEPIEPAASSADDDVAPPETPPVAPGADAGVPADLAARPAGEPATVATESPFAVAGEAESPPLPPPPPADNHRTDVQEGPAAGGQSWKMVLVVVVFLAVVVVAYLLGKKGGGESDQSATPTSSTTVNTTPVNTAGWVTSTVEDAGFSIKHPKDWESLPSTGDVRLLLRIGPESVLGISARDVDASDAPAVIQQAMSDVELIENPRDTSINGLPAVVYIYKKPVTEASPAQGSVVHYFALSKSRMYALVFVTTPPEELNRLALTISAVADSFKSSLEPPGGVTTTTATPGTTTTGAATTTTP